MLNLWVNWSKWSDHIWDLYQRPKQQNSFDNWSIYFSIWNQQLVSKSISVKNVSNGQDKKKEIILDKDRAFIGNLQNSKPALTIEEFQINKERCVSPTAIDYIRPQAKFGMTIGNTHPTLLVNHS